MTLSLKISSINFESLRTIDPFWILTNMFQEASSFNSFLDSIHLCTLSKSLTNRRENKVEVNTLLSSIQ